MLDRVRDDHEPLLVTRRNGDHAVVMSLADFSSHEETRYLTASRANTQRLAESRSQLNAGDVQSFSLETLKNMSE